MESTVWRLQGIDTGGADLILSRIVPWSAGGAVSVLSISSSFSPVGGELENLLVDDGSVCVFAAEDLHKPGFYIEFTLSEPATPWGFRFAGPNPSNWIMQHQIVLGHSVCSLRSPQWSSGVLSPQPTKPLLFDLQYGEWLPIASTLNSGWYRCASSAYGQVLLAATYSDLLHITTDGGATWLPQTALGRASWKGVAVSADGAALFAVGENKAPYLSLDAGGTWTPLSAAGSYYWTDCAISGDGSVLLVTSQTGAYARISSDGGVTWSVVPGVGNTALCCAVSANGQVMLVGTSYYLFISVDGGVTWNRASLPNASYSACCVSADGHSMLVVASAAYPYLSTDGGQTWVAQSSAAQRNWVDCSMSADGEVLLAVVRNSNNGRPWVSTDAGQTWIEQGAAGLYSWEGCHVSGDGSRLLCATRSYHLVTYVFHESIYHKGGVRFKDSQCLIALENQALLHPQGQCPVSAIALDTFDTEHSGPGTIHGTVEQKLTGDATLPLKRRVRLHRSRDGLLVRETWSDAQGNYRFDGLSTRYEYDVIAWDHEGQFRSTIANNLKPEVLP